MASSPGSDTTGGSDNEATSSSFSSASRASRRREPHAAWRSGSARRSRDVDLCQMSESVCMSVWMVVKPLLGVMCINARVGDEWIAIACV